MKNRHSTFIVLYSLAGGLLLIFYLSFGRSLITSIYNGTFCPFVNSIISNQSYLPLSYYHAFALRTIISLWILGVAAILLHRHRSWIGLELDRRFKWYATGIYVLYCLYAGMTFFTPDALEYPITQIDHAFHYTESREAAQHLLQAGRLRGYDPFLCGGMVCDGVDNVWSSGFFIFFKAMGRDPFIYNCAVFLSMILVPLLALFTGRLLGFSKINTMMLYIGAILLTNGYAPMRWGYFTGCFGYVISSWGCFFIVGLTNYYLHNQKFCNLLMLIVSGVAALLIHPLSAVTFVSLFIPFAIGSIRLFTTRTIVQLLFSAIVVLLPVMMWLFPAMNSYSVSNVCENHQTYGGLLWDTIRGNRPFLILIVLFGLALWYLVMLKSWQQVIFLSGGFVILIGIAFRGTQLGLSGMEPSRFIIPLSILCLLSSAMVFEYCLHKNQIVMIFGYCLLFTFTVTSALRFDFGFRQNMTAQTFVDFFKSGSLSEGRILIQTSKYERPYFNSHIPAYLASISGREVTSNAYPLNGPSFPQFVDNKVWNKELSQIADSTFKQYLELYNIAYIVTCKNQERAFLKEKNYIHVALELDSITIFENRAGPTGFCYECKADIHAEYDKITVIGSVKEMTILKYHYYPGLKVRPSYVQIEPVLQMDDPVPFICVKNGNVRDFTIFY